MLIIGIDDAGRGPIIGPMILAGVLVNEEGKEELKKLGIKESKQVLHNHKRIEMSKNIYKVVFSSHIVKAFPAEIDDFVISGKNLNTLEAMKTAEIINKLNDGKEKIKVMVDCPSVNTKAWRAQLLTYIEKPDNLDVHCEHKADVNHLEASAASILAKVTREEEVEKLKKEYAQYGDIGSGYPSDPTTKIFLKEHGRELENSGIFRKSWATWKTLFPDLKKQSSLGDF